MTEKKMVQKIIFKMMQYDANDVRRIQHFLKVYGYAHMIGELEGMQKDALLTLDIAAILHDIGIHRAEEIYGNCNGVHQEELGPKEAEELLREFAISNEMLERICFLIGHHHTYTNVDGLDYQILLEADFLVNAFEEQMSKEAIRTAKERFFKTKTGIDTLDLTFGL